jgi:hypothetical protein
MEGSVRGKHQDWLDNAEVIHSEGKSGLFFLRRLRSFGVCNRMLQMFYQSLMASVLFWNNVLREQQSG